MKVYINRTPRSGPWGGGNMFVHAFHKHAAEHAGLELQVDETMRIDPDVILLAGLENEGPTAISAEQAIMWKMYRPGCKLVLRVNENDARKGTSHMDPLLLKISEHVDATVFVSRWLQDYFVAKGWACPNQTVIYNGVDRDIFKPADKLKNGKVNIVAHHWSDNRMKGADIYEKLDEFVGQNPDKFAFTYIGRHQCDFKHTNVVKPLSGRRLGEELGKHDVYVSASRFDPGPNHCLEAIACGLPTYVHKDGGGCVEFAGPSATYDNWEMLKVIIERLDPNAIRAWKNGSWGLPLNTFSPPTWQTCVREYSQFLEATWKASP